VVKEHGLWKLVIVSISPPICAMCMCIYKKGWQNITMSVNPLIFFYCADD
jgi:hypothetical protein